MFEVPSHEKWEIRHILIEAYRNVEKEETWERILKDKDIKKYIGNSEERKRIARENFERIWKEKYQFRISR